MSSYMYLVFCWLWRFMKHMDSDTFIWQIAGSLFFSSVNFGKIMSRERFEIIYCRWWGSASIRCFCCCQLSFQKWPIHGSFVNLDESIINSFLWNLKGKIKIIRKPSPVRNQIKYLVDEISKNSIKAWIVRGKRKDAGQILHKSLWCCNSN